jgi:ornithine--oxo-acid transaminase
MPARTASPEGLLAAEARHVAHNYHPLPVVLRAGEGAWVTDVDGRRYLDALAGYSALNFGHRHPALVAAARDQLDRITLTSRAFHHDRLAPFATALVELLGLPADDEHTGRTGMVLPMNSGAEAVESALKVARKWGYEVRGVPAGEATIVVAGGNFHGRTITIVSFSDDPDARDAYGPYTPGFRRVPYGDVSAVAAAVDETTVAVLLEPIQGEAGVVVPPADYLPGVRALCDERGVLLVADEIQSGLGRTGTTLACDLVGVRPDLVVLGKALGGGIVPVSAVVGRQDVLGVLRPGQHGSTFGGNPLACAVGEAVVHLLEPGDLQARSRILGQVLRARLDALVGHGLTAVRGAGLWAGLDVDPAVGSGRAVCERLLEHGVLAKDTHGSTLRLAPPLIVTEDEVHWLVDRLEAALRPAA